jgi:hypothetical protein
MFVVEARNADIYGSARLVHEAFHSHKPPFPSRFDGSQSSDRTGAVRGSIVDWDECLIGLFMGW